MFQIGTHVADGWQINHPDRHDPIAIVRDRTDAELVIDALNQRAALEERVAAHQALIAEHDQVVSELNAAAGSLTFARADLKVAESEIAGLRQENERLANELAAAQQLLEQATNPPAATEGASATQTELHGGD